MPSEQCSEKQFRCHSVLTLIFPVSTFRLIPPKLSFCTSDTNVYHLMKGKPVHCLKPSFWKTGIFLQSLFLWEYLTGLLTYSFCFYIISKRRAATSASSSVTKYLLFAVVDFTRDRGQEILARELLASRVKKSLEFVVERHGFTFPDTHLAKQFLPVIQIT